MPWKIDSAGFSNTDFDDVPVSSCQCTFNGAGGDGAVIFIPGNSGGTKPFTEHEDVVIKEPGGANYFQGFVVECAAAASGERQGWRVTLEGNLRKFDRMAYMQQVATGEDDTLVYYGKGVLGWDGDGVRLNTADLLTYIFEYAESDTGVTVGTILSGVDKTAPQMEFDSFSVREAANRVLHWHPDASLYLDHTSNTVAVTRPGAMSTVTKASGGNTSGVVQVELDSLRRQPVAGVTIDWETTSVVDDVTYTHIERDTAGTPPPAMDVVVIPIPLAGEEILTASQECITDTVPRALGDFTAGEWADFLVANWPELAAALGPTPDEDQIEMVSAVQTVDIATKVGLGTIPELDEVPAYPRRLLAGAIPPWQAGISAAHTKLTVVLNPGTAIFDNPELYALFDRGKKKQLELHLEFEGTDAQSINYKTVVAYSAGEEPVTGLASDYHTAMNSAAPSGTITFTGTLDENLKPGKKITLTGDHNITGGVIQSVTADIFTGKTVVRFGPNGVLQPPDFVQLLRAGGRASRIRNTGGENRTSAVPSGREVKGGANGTVKNTSQSTREESNGPFWCTQKTAVSSGTCTIRVGAGVVHAPVDLSPVEPVDIENPIRSFSIAVIESSDVTGVADGDSIWAKVEFEKVSVVTDPVSDTASINAADDYEVTITLTSHHYEFSDITEYIADSDRPDPEDTGHADPETAKGWVEIARVSIADGVVTIDQIQKGALVIPLITAAVIPAVTFAATD